MTAQLAGGADNKSGQRRRQALPASFTCRDDASNYYVSAVRTIAETAFEFCRKCLIWPYAGVSSEWTNLIFEDLDEPVEGKRLDFTEISAVITAGTSTMLPGYTLNIRAGDNGMFRVTVENETAEPPIVLADEAAQSHDIRVAIMEACLEASRKLLEVP